jgi:thioredoxin-like negative regulator of GroEL
VLRALSAAVALFFAGCDDFERRDRPWPDLELTDLNGAPIPGESMLGAPWLVSVWLPACGLCAEEVPELEQVRQKYEGRVKFLALSINDSAAVSERWAKKSGLTLPVAVAKRPVLDALGVRNVPATVVVAPSGKIVGAATGFRSRESLERRIEKLLKEHGGGR